MNLHQRSYLVTEETPRKEGESKEVTIALIESTWRKDVPSGKKDFLIFAPLKTVFYSDNLPNIRETLLLNSRKHQVNKNKVN